MSLASTIDFINSFISSETPEILILKGSWGTGKTYTWEKTLKQAKAENKISLEKYSYVSLFGINSVNELKSAIFENMVDKQLIGSNPNIETLKTNAISAVKSLGFKASPIIRKLPSLKDFGLAFDMISYLSISKTLICIDDFERKGKNLDTRDILGTALNLKEKKNCKIVLILNEDKTKDEAFVDFHAYKDKISDIEIEFNPTPEECAEISLSPYNRIREKIRDHVISLRINNIRIIKKIEKLSSTLEQYLTTFNQEILDQAIHSLSLFTLCKYSDNRNIPDIDFIKKFNFSTFSLNSKDASETEKLWASFLEEYRYLETDKFDLQISELVDKGVIGKSALTAAAERLEKTIASRNSERSFSDAWDNFHNSFNMDDDHFSRSLFESSISNVLNISPANLNSTVILLRRLGCDSEADKLIFHYIEKRRNEVSIFNLDEYYAASDVSDHLIISSFKEIFDSSIGSRTLKDIFDEFTQNRSLPRQDREIISNSTEQDLYCLLKTEEGRQIHSFIRECLTRRGADSSPETEDRLSSLFSSVLRKIGKESKLNYIRVSRYGIDIENTDTSGID